MKATELLDLLTEFYRDKLTLRQRHVAAARFVGNYDFNNTYQYVIAREDLHLNWLRDAVLDMKGALPEVAEPTLAPAGKGAEAQASVIAQDRDAARDFIARWKPRVDAVTHVRHRTMLKVILGETAEQQRFFDLALAGRDDLLGRRADGAGTPGTVLPTRWVGQEF